MKVFIAVLVTAVALVGGYALFAPMLSPSLGASTGPDRYSDYFNDNGMYTYVTVRGFNAASTTVCAIKSPAATSSLAAAAVRFAVSSSTASIVHIAKATTAFATTTNIHTYAVGAGAQATIVASSTVVAGDAAIFAPNTWFVVGMQGGTGTFSPSGVCQAMFRQV